MEPILLGIIPARGGSKGIPDKNLRPAGGLPLIAHSIHAAATAPELDLVLVSTDSERIADAAREHGAWVPFLRPPELATDTAPTLEVLRHAVETVEDLRQVEVGAVVLLQPTSPLRDAADISGAVGLFRSHRGAESLISCYDASAVHPSIMYRADEGRGVPFLEAGERPVRRQDFQPVYVRNGAIYITSRQLLMERRTIIGDRPLLYVMPRERSVNVDEPLDLVLVDCLLRRKSQEAAV